VNENQPADRWKSKKFELLFGGGRVASILPDRASPAGIFQTQAAAFHTDAVDARSRRCQLEVVIGRQWDSDATPLNEVPRTAGCFAISRRSRAIRYVQAQAGKAIHRLDRIKAVAVVFKIK
jgi:hypothetical protein